MSEPSEKIGAMALTLIKDDPHKKEALEFRIAAMKAAAAILDIELARQAMAAALSNALRR